MKIIVQIMSEHNKWANGRLLADCSGVSLEVYGSRPQGQLGSIHDTLQESLRTDGLWLSRFTGEPEDSIFSLASPAGSLEDMAVKRISLDETLCAFSNGLTESRLSKTLSLEDPEGGAEVHQPLCMAMMHMFQQQTHYRAQVQALLSQAGQPVSCLDLYYFQSLTGLGALKVHRNQGLAV